MRLFLPRSRPVPALALALALPLALGATLFPVTSAPSADAAKAKKNPTSSVISEASFGPDDFAGGTLSGATVRGGAVHLKAPRTVRTIGGVRYKAGAWTSPWTTTKNFTELIPSWQATTPGHSLVEVQVRLRTTANGTTTARTGSWDTLARWTSQPSGTVNGKKVYARKSWTKQPDDLASVLTDTVRTNSTAGADAWQVKVVLMRRTHTTTRPVLRGVDVMTSRVVARTATSTPGAVARAGVVLDVPRLSQMTHAGHHPQWGNGGEAWCSPTSVAMVLAHYGANPAESATFSPRWKGREHTDGVVDFTARATYDYAYRGTGNWGFNTAHAATVLSHARVTRLPHLRAAEAHLAAGTPLIVSVAFSRGQLDNAPLNATAGHLMVLVGFTPDGNVIVNDPAARTNDQVRRLYDRAQFEQAWMNRSGGLTYVLED